MLGNYRCGAGWCLALIRSTDGGKRFTRVAAPRFPSQGTGPSVAFANARDGFAYIQDETKLYVTHDGGATWRGAGPAGRVLAFAAGGGEAYVATTRHRLERSPVSHDAWRELGQVPGRVASLAVRGSHVWLLGGPRRLPDFDTLRRSADAGRTFATRPGPCLFELGGSLVPAGGGILWAVCPTGMLAGLWRSRNGGASFASVSAERRALLLPNSAAIAASTPRDAVLSRADGPLLRTTDGGLHWKPVAHTANVTDTFWLRFTTRHVGTAVVQTRHDEAVLPELWRTTDGGATWHDVPLH